jgi:hypothetical protein
MYLYIYYGVCVAALHRTYSLCLMDIELASYVLHFRCVLFTINKCFHFLCSLLLPYWTSLCVFRVEKSSLYETFFYCNILSKHHHHHQVLTYYNLPVDQFDRLFAKVNKNPLYRLRVNGEIKKIQNSINKR